MAEVVHLRSGENPPEKGKWVLVTREEAVRESGVNITQHSDGATFGMAPDEAVVDDVIAQACQWADEHGISEVYVRL